MLQKPLRNLNRAGIVAAWLLLMWSLRLPALSSIKVAGTPSGAPAAGWEAFKALELVFYPVLWFAQPSVLILFPTIFIANVVAFSSPLLYVLFRESSWIMSPALIAGAVCGWLLPEAITGDVFAGFYLWIVSLLLLAMMFAVAPATHRDNYSPPQLYDTRPS